jgi:hypothetical protein
MKCISLYLVTVIILFMTACTPSEKNIPDREFKPDSLPVIFPGNRADIVRTRLKMEAEMKFINQQLPNDIKEWEIKKSWIRQEISRKTGIVTDHDLSLDIKETGSIQMKGYLIKNIYFQTRPGIYATANLYIPDGKGPFPGVIFMCGHSSNARLYDQYQAAGHSLALKGYVCLAIDPWGAGERATFHGNWEYHGSHLGASLLNIGESLMGMQITDNIRGVDLLVSLPYIDREKIGATGASGGGNQTMWLAAMDDRVKIAIPVVSVGTFESYVMGHNCVCETLVDGLTFTEESGILALVAPRVIALFNGLKDSNPAFFPSEMLRSYANAKPIFNMYNAGDNLINKIFDLTHGYHPEMRQAMLGLFDLHLKGIGKGESQKELPYEILPEEKLMVFPKGQRDEKVTTTAQYCINRGNELRMAFLEKKKINKAEKISEIKKILRLEEEIQLKKVHHFPEKMNWDIIALETNDGRIIPLLHHPPATRAHGYVIVCDPEGKENLNTGILHELAGDGTGIIIADLSGTGEAASLMSASNDRLARLHTVARSELWLGKTVMGEWVKEIGLIAGFLQENFNAYKISVVGNHEAGIAGLFASAVYGNIDIVTLRETPVSFLFDDSKSINYFSMAVYIPGILTWGDVSLAAALTGRNVKFINPVTISGHKLAGSRLNEIKKEYENVRKISGQSGKTLFY